MTYVTILNSEKDGEQWILFFDCFLSGSTRHPGREIASRWTTQLMDGGWTPISNFFLEHYSNLDPPIKHGEAIFIIHLMQFKWDDKAPYPSVTTIANRMGISATATRSYARNLENKGYLKRTEISGKANRYDLTPLFGALERLELR